MLEPAVPALVPPAVELTAEQFQRVCRLTHQVCGIHLQPGKEQLVKARLWKRVRALGLASYEVYLSLVESATGKAELAAMVDALTTNKTSFFRESQHFDFLSGRIQSVQRGGHELRIWCAGCSSGQEPYSIIMTLLEAQADVRYRGIAVLATDISSRVLEEAKAGGYDEAEVENVPPSLRQRYFRVIQASGARRYEVAAKVRGLARFARLNLMDRWPMRGPFDYIFCRNVMIYFDKPTQLALVDRFRALLRPEGYLFVGHSESLAGKARGYRYVMPAVYQQHADGTSDD